MHLLVCNSYNSTYAYYNVVNNPQRALSFILSTLTFD